jgi:hypothetical protein
VALAEGGDPPIVAASGYADLDREVQADPDTTERYKPIPTHPSSSGAYRRISSLPSPSSWPKRVF